LAGKSKSSKHLKAEQLISAGYAIRIIGESDLETLLNS
jgi:DNA polymerase-3 subunit epsilon